MMNKIEKLLTISDKMKDGKKKEMARVHDFDIEDIAKLDKTKFKKGESQRGIPRLEANCFVILKDDFEEFEKDINSQIESMESSIEDKEKTIKMLQDELSAIHSEHQKEIKKLDDEYSAKIDELNAVIHEKDLEIERTKTRYEKEIGNLKESNQREINSLELFDDESHMSIIEHQDEIFDLKEAQWKEISGIKDKIVMETIHHNDNLNSLENNLNLLGYIRGDYKSSLKNLKEDIEAFKYIAQYIESKETLILPDVKMKEDDEDSS